MLNSNVQRASNTKLDSSLFLLASALAMPSDFLVASVCPEQHLRGDPNGILSEGVTLPFPLWMVAVILFACLFSLPTPPPKKNTNPPPPPPPPQPPTKTTRRRISRKQWRQLNKGNVWCECGYEQCKKNFYTRHHFTPVLSILFA